MSKHTPATPLPWNVGAVHTARYPAYPINGQGRNVAQVDIRAQGGSNDDAAYIAHAANAYPRLVEALRQQCARWEELEKQWSGSDGWEEADGRALLRELGEDA